MRPHSFFTPCAIFLQITACLAASYGKCHSPNFDCAGINMSYPFGILNQGCGLLGFQVDCEGNPQLHVHRNDYRILNASLISQRRITMVNQKLFKACSLDPDVYDDLSNSHFLVSRQNSNITELRDCGKKIPKQIVKFHCNNRSGEFEEWYFGFDVEKSESCTEVYSVPVLEKPKTMPKQSSQFIQLLRRGFQVEWQDPKIIFPDCGSCEATKGICGYHPYTETFCCYCPNGSTHLFNCSDGGSIGVLGVIVTTVLIVLFYTRSKPKRNTEDHGFCKERGHSLEAGRKIGILPIFSYHELEEATNFFSEENQLGNGGFGSVYLGCLKDGRSVAVKRLYQDNTRRVEQFLNEIEILSSLHHQNLVRLFGCTCPNTRDLLLVYEYIPNGTLADHLHGERKRPGGLNWGTRLNIAVETAQALAFLHCFDPPIFHRDVKSANILLDENFKAKVSDFGLSKLATVNVSHVTTAPHGTPGYVDPEYHQSFQLTEKSDVYSFGVVLVEIISAKLAVDVSRNRREISLAHLAVAKIQAGALHELVDPDLDIEMNFEVKRMVNAVAELAYECLAIERDDRPDMRQVVFRLEQIRNSGSGGSQSVNLNSITVS
ncbi:LEAF RUST 10 DISEASE-RESISTANCE LOCUS RECEPTOR-LIKE PROTEIN KINASE-like 1.2 isoform X2 [Cryptomeria japonica]|uniref:LEAF RUST 10 DISEASE-RESISTANCE LOCUS RECEPTOR-LIKE PROTEIN KINASE-like 1.2 isoform X2 n=1 Tax=Cryptomeria japonica TaxID=3369 RepID=UPI0025AC1E48|nr:LEAF RUST 10 DISEASE-RESISTANCE LOCUS RECEPTOR-LIKE PROTEIN KINASE-like 1.2 isoform X2 [Cryptomeria japonica]